MNLEVLRDGAWQFVGAVFALVAIAVTVLLYYYQRERRELAFGVLYETQLLSVSTALANRAQISFDGHVVPNIRLVVLALKNSGNRPILASDFQSPFAMRFGEAERPLSVEVSKQFPADLDASVQLQDEQVLVQPLLLNPGDYLVFKVLTTGESNELSKKARIVGVSKVAAIKPISDLPGRQKVRRNLIVLPILSVAAGAFLAFKGDSKSLLVPSFLIVLAIVPVIQWLIEYFSNDANRYVDDA